MEKGSKDKLLRTEEPEEDVSRLPIRPACRIGQQILGQGHIAAVGIDSFGCLANARLFPSSAPAFGLFLREKGLPHLLIRYLCPLKKD